MERTLVVGGGISGLACAHALLGAGRDVRVLEASARAGGCVRTLTHEGFRWEEGPELLPGPAHAVRALCQELDLPVHVPPAAARGFLAVDGKLLEVPTRAQDLATSRVLSFGAKLRLMAEPTCARDEALDGSIADFARHRFGKEALERVVEPLVALIHAGDPERLSLRACFPAVVRMVEEHGSLGKALQARAATKSQRSGPGSAPLTLGGGMQRLTDALALALGPRLALGVRVLALERAGAGFRALDEAGASHAAERVVLALPLAEARALLAGPAPAAAAALADMRAEGLVSVAHAHRRADVAHALDGCGYLVPGSAGGLELATFFSSSLDPGAAPPGHVLLRSLLGGARDRAALDLDDETLGTRLAAECGAYLGIARPPLFVRVARYAQAIPQFDPTHLERRARLSAGLPPGLAVLGNFVRSQSLDALVAEARELVAAP